MIKDHLEFLRHYGFDPKIFATMRSCEGAIYSRLTDRLGEKDLYCGSTFKFQRKGVVIEGDFFHYPLDIGALESRWKSAKPRS